MTETTESIPSPVAEPRRLMRSRDGRWLGGVCAGLGRYFNLSPMIYRIAFVALALAGGTGVLLYVAAWLVIPDEGAADSIAADAVKGQRDRPWLLVGVGLLGFAAILALSSARVWPNPGNLWVAAAIAGAAIVWWQVSTRDSAAPAAPAAPGEPLPPRVRRRSLAPLALGILICGFGIVGLIDVATHWSIDWRIVLAVAAVVLGALVAAGAATGRGVGGVVVLALGVLAAFAVATVVHVPLFAGVGDQNERPFAVSGVDSTYTHGIGNLVLHLNDVAFPSGTTHVKATLGIGDLIVDVPNDVTVDVNARANMGDVELFGQSSGGRSTHTHLIVPGTEPKHVLVLDLRVGLGKVEVHRR